MSIIESTLDKLRRRESPGDIPAATRVVAPMVVREFPPRPEPVHRMHLDPNSLRAAGYLPEEGEDRRLADYYRRVKRPLIERALAPAASPEMRLIMITSALPGDGKTFTSINLALSIGRERDVSVLLVDADLPNGQVTRAFGLAESTGLSDALQNDKLDVESLVIGTDMRGLDILPAGRPVENAAELVASNRMLQIAEQLAQRAPNRLVLLDSPPLLMSSESRALVQVPGQVVLVVRAGVTPQRAVLESLTLVDKNKLQGLVLNEARIGRGDGYYTYGYGYGSAAKSREE